MSFKLAGIFFCFTLLLIGTIVLLSEMSLDYNSVINACKYGFIGAFAAGLGGYLIGKILNQGNSLKKTLNSKKKNKSNDVQKAEYETAQINSESAEPS